MAHGKSLQEKESRPEPVQLCIKRGCGLPWSDHLTKKGTLLKKYQDSGHATGEGSMGRQRLRGYGIGKRGFAKKSLSRRKKALPAIATHVAVVIETDEQRAELEKRGIKLKGRKTTVPFQTAPDVFPPAKQRPQGA